MIKAVFLDLGNVLVFHDDALLLQRLAARAGSTPRAVQRALQPVWDPCHRGWLAGDHLRTTISQAIGAELTAHEFWELWNCHFRIHDEVLPLVQSLIGRVKLFLLSNTNAAHLDFVRPQLPVLERFDGLLLSYELGLAKPEPAIFHEALRRAAVTPDQAAYFDDVAPYVEAARALGIHGRVFTDARQFGADLEALDLSS